MKLELKFDDNRANGFGVIEFLVFSILDFIFDQFWGEKILGKFFNPSKAPPWSKPVLLT